MYYTIIKDHYQSSIIKNKNKIKILILFFFFSFIFYFPGIFLYSYIKIRNFSKENDNFTISIKKITPFFQMSHFGFKLNNFELMQTNQEKTIKDIKIPSLKIKINWNVFNDKKIIFFEDIIFNNKVKINNEKKFIIDISKKEFDINFLNNLINIYYDNKLISKCYLNGKLKLFQNDNKFSNEIDSNISLILNDNLNVFPGFIKSINFDFNYKNNNFLKAINIREIAFNYRTYNTTINGIININPEKNINIKLNTTNYKKFFDDFFNYLIDKSNTSDKIQLTIFYKAIYSILPLLIDLKNDVMELEFKTEKDGKIYVNNFLLDIILDKIILKIQNKN